MLRSKLACMAILALALPVRAEAQTRSFFEGQTISLVVGFGVGGGYGTYSRLLARFLGNHIPGHPTVIVRNMPGGGGLTQINYMYNVAPADGTAIGGTQPEVPFQPIFLGNIPQIKFNPLDFHWLGSPAQFASVAYAWHTAPVKSAQDLMQRELIVGSSGGNSTTDAWLTNSIMGFKYKVVSGYNTGADVDLAVERGEVQGRASIGWSGLKIRGREWMRTGKINLLYQMGLAKHPAIPAGTPLILDLARSDEDRQTLAIAFAPYEVGYPYMLPPKTPADRVAILRAAFAETVQDPEFRKAAEEVDLDVGPVTGEKIEAILRQAYSAPTNVIQRLIAAETPPGDSNGK